jgi:hypothetical protein
VSPTVLLLLFAAALVAQDQTPLGIVRGELLEWEGSPARGEFSIRATDDHVYRCAYDSKTYLERDKQRISIITLKPGEKVEMVADYRQSSGKCYAMMMHVLDPTPPPGPFRRTQPYRSATESIFPRGDLTFAGVVLKLTTENLLLRTRAGSEQRFTLRTDTRYLAGGAVAEAAMLLVNTRVFIRAGKNLDGQIEAFQIVWGEILPAR